MEAEAEVLAVGELEVRPAEHCAWAGGTMLALSLRELELLAALARRAGRIVPRAELYETVWGGTPAAGRPLGRRLRPQAPREAGRGAARVAVHPHPLRLRLPAGADAFTFFSHRRPPGPDRSAIDTNGEIDENQANPGGRLAGGVTGSWSSRPAGATDSSSGGSGSSFDAGGSINGAGATFPLPVYQEWAARLKDKDGLTVNYQGIGSGGGIAQFTAGTVDFGATDSAMADEELAAAKKKGDPVHVPSVFGAVTVSYNVQGVDKGLKLDGATIADIFLGKITKWNDPAIAKLEPGREAAEHRHHGLPPLRRVGHDQAVHDVPRRLLARSGRTAPASTRRSSGRRAPAPRATTASPPASSRTTARSATSSRPTRWRTTSRSRRVKNKAGNFVAPTLESTSAAGDGLTVPDDLRFSAIDAPGDQAYPITSGTFLLVYQDMCKAGLSKAKAQSVKALARLRARRRPGRGQGAAVRAAARRTSRPRPRRRSTA